MTLQFRCPTCQVTLAADAAIAGGQVRCSACGQVFTVAAVAQPTPVVRPQVVAGSPAQSPRKPAAPGIRRSLSPPSHPRTVKAAPPTKSLDPETKAKLMVAGVFVGGISILGGLVYLGNELISKKESEIATLDQQAMQKGEDARREMLRREEEKSEAREKAVRAKQIADLARTVCDGDEAVARAILAEIDQVRNELEHLDAIGRLPSDTRHYADERLMTRMTENATVSRWLLRKPAGFLAALITGPRQRGADPSEDNGIASLVGTDYSANGTGFFIAPDGWLVTNRHVVGNAARVDIRTSAGKIFPAKVVKIASDADIALLKVDITAEAWLPLSAGEVPMGASVFTIGYPKANIQGIEPKFTDGRVSSASGLRDEKTFYQVSVPVQPGNSGGPLVHMQTGWVIGMVTSVLTGENVQNVNFAIKSPLIKSLIESTPGAKDNFQQNAADAKSSDESSLISRVKSSTVLILIK